MKRFLTIMMMIMLIIAPMTLLSTTQYRSLESTFFFDFNDNSIDGLKTVDRDEDGNNWLVSDEGYIYSESSESIKPNNIIATVEKYTIYTTSKIHFDVRPSEQKDIEKYGIGVVYSLDGETFMTIQDETVLASETEWNNIEISLDYIANKEVYIGILHNTQDDQGIIMVDNIRLSDGLLNTVTKVTAEEDGDNVEITWGAPLFADETNELYAYRLYRSNDRNDKPIIIADELQDVSYTDNTWSDAEWGIYKYGVAALYKEKTRSTKEIVFQENFESTEYPNIPENWTTFTEPSTANAVGKWAVNTTIENLVSPYEGDKFAYSTGGYDNNSSYYYLVTPSIDLKYALEPVLNFNYAAPGLFENPGNPLFVKCSESQTGPWNTIWSDTANLNWRNASLDLSEYSGKKVYIAFVAQDLKNFGVGVDNISIEAQISDTPLPTASKIVWSNTVEKDMFTTVDITVTTDGNDSAQGALVTLQNSKESEYKYEANLDGEGKTLLSNVRRGTYEYTVALDGFYTLEGNIEVVDAETLNLVLESLPELIDGLYVSPTAWAMWEFDGTNITYDVKLDDVLVAENISEKYYQHDESSLSKGTTYKTTILPKGHSEKVMMEYTWEYAGCNEFANAVNFSVKKVENNAVLSWTMPTYEAEQEPVYEFSVNFDNGTLEGWTTIDADGDGRNWQNTSEFANQGFGIEDTYCVTSISYDTEHGAFNPNNFLISDKKYTITESSRLTYHVSAQSKDYPAEHYGIAISTKSNSKADDFEVIFDETLTAGEVEEGSTQGQWFEKTINLSEYAGQEIYIAFRHYDSRDNSWLKVDNISLESSTRGTASEKGDWLYYDNGVYKDAAGNYDASTMEPTQIFWAIMFPEDLIADYAGRTLSKVAIFDYSAHRGAFSIHEGGTDAPGNMVHVQSYETTGKKTFVEIELDTPIKISGKENVWIQFSNEYGSGTYPAAYSTDMGDPNSRWRSDDGSFWYDSEWFGEGWYGTWMIRAFVNEKDETIIEDPEVATAEPLGTIIYRNGELITPEPIKEATYTDAITSNDAVEYSIRVVYGGTKDISYYAMSCPNTKTFNVIEPLVCEKPKDLYGNTTINEDGSFGATLVWPYMKKWFYYDDGEVLESKVGAGGTIYWGIMIPAKDLEPYVGGGITELSLFGVETCDATLNIAFGGDFAPGTTVHSQEFSFKGDYDYQTLRLTSPIPVTGEENIWITIYQSGSPNPAAVTKNTGDPNGRWCSLNGTTWGDLTAMNEDLDFTWYLRAYVSNEAKGGSVYEIERPQGKVGSEFNSVKFNHSNTMLTSRGDDANFDHYNVYRSETNDNYQLIAETTANRYFDEIERGTYYYQVTAVYKRGEETCESEPATAYEDENKDYVIVEVTAINENGVRGMMVYPNPTNGYLNISAENMNRITICNTLGQVVYDSEANTDNEIINMSQYKAGIYLVRIATENGVAVKRISVTK